jgi:hypothetical protein
MRTFLVLAAVLAVTGCTATSARSAGGPPPAPGTSAAVTTAAAAPPAGDFCALTKQVNNQIGVMVGDHYISPLKETLDQLKAATEAYLAHSAEFLAAVPDDLRPSLLIEGQYFRALKDNNYATTTPLPDGFRTAIDKLNAYQAGTCGFVFDK